MLIELVAYIPTGTTVTGASNAGGVWKKSQFSTNISLYLENDKAEILGHSYTYYGMQVGNRTEAF